MRAISGHSNSTAGNFCFDPDDNLYICTGNEDVPEDNVRGVVYRVPAR